MDRGDVDGWHLMIQQQLKCGMGQEQSTKPGVEVVETIALQVLPVAFLFNCCRKDRSEQRRYISLGAAVCPGITALGL